MSLKKISLIIVLVSLYFIINYTFLSDQSSLSNFSYTSMEDYVESTKDEFSYKIEDIIYEDEQIFAIHDINPVAKVHILVIPKKKIPTINDISDSDIGLIGSMFLCAKNLAKEFDIDQTGYRLLFNTNADAMQTVFHIHLHLIGGEKLKNI